MQTRVLISFQNFYFDPRVSNAQDPGNMVGIFTERPLPERFDPLPHYVLYYYYIGEERVPLLHIYFPLNKGTEIEETCLDRFRHPRRNKKTFPQTKRILQIKQVLSAKINSTDENL